MRLKNSIFVILFFAASACAQNWTQFEADVNKTLKDWQLPGAAIAIVKNGKIIYAKGFGVREIGKSARVDENTVFAVASNSKSFTAAAIELLADEGKLDLDDKVTKYLPDFKIYDDYVSKEITIRDLLCHRSGLPAYGGDILWWGADYSRDEIVERVRFVKPRFGFRSSYAYQNIPFIIAGQIVAKVSGKSWDNFVKERFLQPLNMSSTTSSFGDAMKVENKTSPHFRYLNGKTIPINWRGLDNGAAAAGLNSNVLDMTNWLKMQLDGGEFEGKRILSKRAVLEMQSPQNLIPFSNPPAERLRANFRAYGLGLMIREYNRLKLVHHGGWADGQLTLTAMLPEKNIGVVVLTNIHNRSPYNAMLYSALDTALGLPKFDWNNYFLKLAIEDDKSAIAQQAKDETRRQKNASVSDEMKRQILGSYTSELYGKIKFTDENGEITVRMSHSPTYIGKLEYWGGTEFRVTWQDTVAETTFANFERGSDGRISSVKMALTGFIDDAVYTYKRTD